MEFPRVYIIIVNYREWEDCLECVLSVLNSTYRNYSIFIIDNHSGNRSLEKLMDKLKEGLKVTASLQPLKSSIALMTRVEFDRVSDLSALPQIVLIQNDCNAGFASANNIVLRKLPEANGYFWLLNPDMVITPTTLFELLSFSLQLPKNSVTGAKVLAYSGNQEVLFYGGARVNFLAGTVRRMLRSRDVLQLDYISGGCLFCQTSNLQELGLLPEQYFLYWEETEWCYAAKEKGYELHVSETATCFDKGSTSIGKDFVADYYYARNGLLFISRFRPANVPIVMFFLGGRFLKRVFSGRLQRARGIYRGALDYLKMKPYESQ